jgi:hypothetical protein
LLAENAIKHNEFSDDVPLVFKVSLRNDELIVWNALSKKELRKPSSRIGLQNLRERYRLTTAKEIGINENAEEFVVTLPLLRIL